MPKTTLFRSPVGDYRWKKYNPRNRKSLEDPSRRPKSTRKPTWTLELVEGLQKLLLFLREEGFQVFASTVGRILRSLKTRGLLREPERTKKVRVTKHKRTSRRPHAERKPRDYRAKFPGDLVAIDTLDIPPLPGKVYKQFTAQDLISRFAFASLSTQATASAARRFLEEILKKSPFPVKAIQCDGGSEFYGVFEEACKEYGLRLFILPPRSPKLNGVVERLNRTFREEF